MRKIFKILPFLMVFTFTFSFVVNVFAQPSPNPLGGVRPPEGILSDVRALGAFISAIIRLLVIVSGVATLIVLLIGGIQYSTAGGDPKSTEAARGRITAGIIGLLITLSTFVIIKLVEFFFGVPILKFDLPQFVRG